MLVIIPLRSCPGGCSNFRGTVGGAQHRGCQAGREVGHRTIIVSMKHEVGEGRTYL